MKKLIIIIAACAFGVNAAWTDSRYLDLVDQADKAAKEQNWQRADSLLVEALRDEPANPSNALLVSNLGMVRFYDGRDSLALATLDDALAMAPNSVAVLANRARVLTANGRVVDAIADYDCIEQIDSTFVDTYLYRGLIYLYGGNFEKAEPDLRRLNTLAPNREETWIAMASYHSILDQPEEALPYYRKLIDHASAPEYYAARAMILIKRDALLDAAEDIASGLELDPNYAELYLCRALLNKKRYLSVESAADAQRAISLGSDPARVKMLLGL